MKKFKAVPKSIKAAQDPAGITIKDYLKAYEGTVFKLRFDLYDCYAELKDLPDPDSMLTDFSDPDVQRLEQCYTCVKDAIISIKEAMKRLNSDCFR